MEMEDAVKELAKKAAEASVAARAQREEPPAPEPEQGYRGVRPKRYGSYGAMIRNPSDKRRRIWLGSFKTAEEAAHAYDAAARSLLGQDQLPAAAAGAGGGRRHRRRRRRRRRRRGHAPEIRGSVSRGHALPRRPAMAAPVPARGEPAASLILAQEPLAIGFHDAVAPPQSLVFGALAPAARAADSGIPATAIQPVAQSSTLQPLAASVELHEGIKLLLELKHSNAMGI
ncbi:hypothetical protein ACP4OV_014148 [Aristida adscensionis]